ncbi:hypothetical protein Q9L58_007636 [Maublancomyces gigas]|uniref:Uncharacterized protein n=1 Tax=Discina gigas TaxID=1032678 RepID=A0ABR3GCB4_9PEZI
MADPIPGDSLLSTLSNTAKVLADSIFYARNTLNHACPDGTSQGLSAMAQESLLRSKQGIDELEQIQWSIDAIIIREQARGDRGYVPAMTVDCPDYREHHMSVLGNEVVAMLSVIDRNDSPGAGIDLPDQVMTPGWTEFNEKYSEKVEYRPDNEEAPGSGGSRSTQYYYKCIYNGCLSKPLRYKSKLRCVFLMYRREYPPIYLFRWLILGIQRPSFGAHQPETPLRFVPYPGAPYPPWVQATS